jgi:hypothetical protein
MHREPARAPPEQVLSCIGLRIAGQLHRDVCRAAADPGGALYDAPFRKLEMLFKGK